MWGYGFIVITKYNKQYKDKKISQKQFKKSKINNLFT